MKPKNAKLYQMPDHYEIGARMDIVSRIQFYIAFRDCLVKRNLWELAAQVRDDIQALQKELWGK